jgi:hypothetical protein
MTYTQLHETPLYLLRCGFDTVEIAKILKMDEATAYNAINREKNNERGLSFNPAIYKKIPYPGKGTK